MAQKRNYEWPQATAWDGFFTQDKAGGTTQRVDPLTVETRLQTDGFHVTKREEVATVSGVIELVPNHYTILGVLGSVEFTLGTITNPSAMNEYFFRFSSGSTAAEITWPSGLQWVGGFVPIISPLKSYEVSILDNVAVLGEYE